MGKEKLVERLSWYYPLERFHTFVTVPFLIGFLIYYYGFEKTVLINSGLILCSAILYQGQLYWGIKLRKITGKEIDNDYYLKKFEKWTRTNPILLSSIVLTLPVHLILKEFKTDSFLFWGLFAHFFYVLEYVNYYKKQLMYDNINDFKYLLINRKLKKSSLLKDMQKRAF